MREDLFTVVHDLFLTDTCHYADLVLPATSHFENLDLYSSYWHLYLQLHEPIMPPLGECKSNFTLFKELGLRMGFEPEHFDLTEADMIRQSLESDSPLLAGVTYEALQANGWMKVNGGKQVKATDYIRTPSGKIELFSRQLARTGLSPVPTYEPLKEPGDLPFLFVSGPNHSFINSTFGNQDRLTRLEKQPLLDMHRDDAAVRGLQSGDTVRVWNNRGEITITVRVADNVLPGVVVCQGLWWEKDNQVARAVNVLTSQRLADMGGGATFFSTRVEVEKA